MSNNSCDIHDYYNHLHGYGLCLVCCENAGPLCNPCFVKQEKKEREIERIVKEYELLRRQYCDEHNTCNDLDNTVDK